MKLEVLEIFMKTGFGEILVLYDQPRFQGLYTGLGAVQERGCSVVGKTNWWTISEVNGTSRILNRNFPGDRLVPFPGPSCSKGG